MNVLTTQKQDTTFTRVSDIVIPSAFFNRMKTGIAQFDTLFGEGILPGSTFTFTGSAGVGKTTVLLQLMEAFATAGFDVGYASGEESSFQVAYTCKRLKVEKVSVANITDIDTLVKVINLKKSEDRRQHIINEFDILVVDSFQSMTTKDKLNQSELERYAVSKLISAAKENECALFFVCHFTKSGNQLKGSSLIPHAVDVNFMITSDPDGEETSRIISVYKNRYGRTGDYTATMTPYGLELSGRVEVVQNVSKKNKKKNLSAEILKLDPPNITKKAIMERFSLTSSQAYLALKELVDAGKLVRYGRGDSSVFKKTI